MKTTYLFTEKYSILMISPLLKEKDCLKNKDYIGAAVCASFGALDLLTYGATSAIIKTAEELSVNSAKEAAISATK